MAQKEEGRGDMDRPNTRAWLREVVPVPTRADGSSPMKRLVAVLILLSCAVPASAAAGPPLPAIAVLPQDAGSRSPDLVARQAGLVHLVQSELQARSAVRVLSRSQTALFLDELGLAAAGLTEPRTAQRYGRALSADYLVLIRLAGDGEAASAAVWAERVTDGAQVWERTFRVPAREPAVPAREIAAALAQALGLPPAPAPASTGGATPTLAVLDFHSEGEASEFDAHLAHLADLLCADLTALEIPLVERGRLNAALQEQALSASGLVRPASLSRIGALLGAQQVLEISMIVTGREVLFDGQLIAPETGMVTGSCRTAGLVTDTPALLQQFAVKVAGALQSPVSDSGRQNLARQETQSLEAALHAAAGWRLSWENRPEEAIPELQRAIYLDPNLASAWEELARQYEALNDYEKWADCARRFFAAAGEKADPQLRAAMAKHLADAELWQGHYAEEEAAARLAMSCDPNNADRYADLIMALARQGKAKEVRDFCEDIYRQYGAGSFRTYQAFAFGVLWLGWREVPADYTEAAIEAEFDLISRTLDVFAKELPGPDYYYGRFMTHALMLACGAMPPNVLVADLQTPVQHAEECLRLAKRMASCTDRPWISRGGWYVVGLIEYKLGHGKEAEEALNHCLEPSGPSFGFDLFLHTYQVSGEVYYLLGHVYQDLLQDRPRAIASYQQAARYLALVTPEARSQLVALGADPTPRVEWRRTLGPAGAALMRAGREQFLAWVGAHGYNMQFALAPRAVQDSEEGVQVLMWEGRRSDVSPEGYLRAYVAGGGSLLIVLADPYYHVTQGSLLGGSAESVDVTLDWLLPAFGVRLSSHVVPVGPPTALLPGERPLPLNLQGVEYTGSFFPIEAPAGQSFLRLQRPGQSQPDTVAAGVEFGLGKVAVVSLRGWFAAGDTAIFPPPVWQFELLDGIMDWLSTPPEAAPGAEQWAAARAALAERDFPGAVEALNRISASDPDAAYWAGWLLDDKLGDRRGAWQQYQQVLTMPQADAWLKRSANLALGVLSVRRGDEAAAGQYLSAAAGLEPDTIWGRAQIAAGDLKLAEGDFLGAAQAFREVTDELGHSEERFRALFGLAYALGKQGKPEASARIYEAIAVEFGKAPLPADMDTRWPDPWREYYPPETRTEEPTVAEAVAAGEALLEKAYPGTER